MTGGPYFSTQWEREEYERTNAAAELRAREEAVLSAARAWGGERITHDPEEKALAVAVARMWPDDWQTKENCKCGDSDNCDECVTRACEFPRGPEILAAGNHGIIASLPMYGELNANVISAAPELLAALKAARTELEAYEEAATGESYNNTALNAAIAKAEGAKQ